MVGKTLKNKMKKNILFLLLCFIALNSNSQTLYDENGLSLYYTANIYNTVSIEGTNYYDQYEVKVYFKNASGRVIFSPSMITVQWDQDALLKGVRKYYTYEYDNATNTKTKYMRDSFPQSSHNVLFGFPDGKRVHYNQPAPYNSGSMFQAADYPEYLMLDGQIDSCTLYILVEQGQDLPTPKWNVSEIKFKDNFKKSYLSVLPDKNCGCTGKHKPRGKRGDKPKGAKESVAKNNSKPKYQFKERVKRSKEELRNVILKNLRENTKDELTLLEDMKKSFASQTLESATGTTFQIEGDVLTFSLKLHTVSEKKGKETFDIVSVINLKRIYDLFPHYTDYSFNSSSYFLQNGQFDRDCILECFYTWSRGIEREQTGITFKTWLGENANKDDIYTIINGRKVTEWSTSHKVFDNVFGYNRGENNVNSDELIAAIKEYKKSE
jgi:hypothetical protein